MKTVINTMGRVLLDPFLFDSLVPCLSSLISVSLHRFPYESLVLPDKWVHHLPQLRVTKVLKAKRPVRSSKKL